MAEKLDALGIHLDKSIVQMGSQSRTGDWGEQWPLLRLGKSCGSLHIVQYPLRPPAQSPLSNGAGTMLPLCVKSGQTHPGHSLQTAFTTCIFAVFQFSRGELSPLAAALPSAVLSAGAWPERVVAQTLGKRPPCPAWMWCASHHGVFWVHSGTQLLLYWLKWDPRTGFNCSSPSPSFSSLIL